nr:unnamed protein product [Spirometra erinaceieuropaei]
MITDHASIAALLIDYVYTGQVEMTQANAKGLVMLARILDLPFLEHWGAEFMASSVNSENLAVTWDFARSLNIRVLSEACIHHMKTHFESFVCSDLFVRLPADTVLALLRSEDLAIESEEEVFEAISRWVSPCVDGDREKLTLHAATMLRHVQWHRTTVQFRKRLMESHPIFQNSLEFAQFLVLVEQWIGAEGGNKPPCPFNILSRRMSPPQSFVIYGMEKNENKWSVFLFDSSLRKAERIGFVGLRYGASFSVVGESLFAVGGWNENQYASKDVNEFLVREQSWRQRPSLIVPRFDHAAAVVSVHTGDNEGKANTLIGIFGGSVRRGDTYRRLRCCEVYDVNRDRWHKLPNLREKRCGAAAAVLPDDNRVFLFGGRSDAGVSASVEFCQLRTLWPEASTFEIDRNFWLPAAPMRTARAFLAAAHFRGRIIVAGGWDYREDVNVVEMFSPPDAVRPLGQWTELAAMKQPRAFSAILTSVDSVFVLGKDS